MTSYGTKARALKAGKPSDGNRLYEVTVCGEKYYVLAKGKSTAALELCDVRLVSQREIAEAAWEMLGVSTPKTKEG